MTVLDDYDAWCEERERLNKIEDEGDEDGAPPASNDWHASDDGAVLLLEQTVDALRRALSGVQVALAAFEGMTTEDFQRGADRPLRSTLVAILAEHGKATEDQKKEYGL